MNYPDVLSSAVSVPVLDTPPAVNGHETRIPLVESASETPAGERQGAKTLLYDSVEDPEAPPYRVTDFQTAEMDERFLTEGRIYRRDPKDPFIVTIGTAAADAEGAYQPVTIPTPSGPRSVTPKYGQIIVYDAVGNPAKVMWARQFSRQYEGFAEGLENHLVFGTPGAYVAKPEMVRVIPHPSGEGKLAVKFDPKMPDKVLFDRYPMSDTRFAEFWPDVSHERRSPVAEATAAEEVVTAAVEVVEVAPVTEEIVTVAEPETAAISSVEPEVATTPAPVEATAEAEDDGATDGPELEVENTGRKLFDFAATPAATPSVGAAVLAKVARMAHENTVRQPAPPVRNHQPVSTYLVSNGNAERPSRLKRVVVAAIASGVVLIGALSSNGPHTAPSNKPSVEVTTNTPVPSPNHPSFIDPIFSR